MSKQVRVGVACFVWKDDTFLMGRRKGSHGADTWSVPGGHLEMNETWEEAAIREVFEETSIRITNCRLLTVTNDVMHDDEKHYISIWMEADYISGEPTLNEPDKWVDQGWYTFDTLPSPLFSPYWDNLKQQKPDLFS